MCVVISDPRDVIKLFLYLQDIVQLKLHRLSVSGSFDPQALCASPSSHGPKKLSIYGFDTVSIKMKWLYN